MPTRANGDITAVLTDMREGLPDAPNRLMALVYVELKKIARNRLAGRSKNTSDATTLVHEAYLRLFNGKKITWENRHHFFFAAARAMRDILVDRARRQQAKKRGGGRVQVDLDADVPDLTQATDLLAIHDVLDRLEQKHPDTARIVLLIFFAGLSREDVAAITGMSESAVWREWNFAKAWLLDALAER